MKSVEPEVCRASTSIFHSVIIYLSYGRVVVSYYATNNQSLLYEGLSAAV